MTPMTPAHPNFERLSELADLREAEVIAREPHLRDCAECRQTVARVRALVAAARALPGDVAPPAEVWSALRARVTGTPRRGAFARVVRSSWFAAAAAIVLLAGTAILLPRGAGKAKGAKAGQPHLVASDGAAVLAAVDRNYTPTLAELRQSLDVRRAALTPAASGSVDASLALVDSAIAETRSALVSDPANTVLVHLLSASYERKLELLQRATELTSSF